jgi:SNF2 family DNA or RNA helicase
LVEKLQVEVEEGHQALVFSSFTSLLDLAQSALAQAGISTLRLDGSTPAKERTRRVAEFQSESGAKVFLISIKAGGAGLNLTAADYVFLLDPWWNPAVEEQAAARSHRIGQERPVIVYRMVSKETVEEKILRLSARKADLARELLDEEGAAQNLLDATALRELFGA